MKPDRIVTGIDFSRPSTAAARWIATSFAPDAELILVHALDRSRPPDFLARRDIPFDPDTDERERKASERLQRLARSIRAERIRTAVGEGRSATVLASIARTERADLVVVGEHARRNPVRDLLSTTSEALLALSPAPVLLARRVPDHAPERLLAPIEPSDMAPVVLRTAADLAARWNAHIQVLYVINAHWAGRIALTSTESRTQQIEERMIESGRDWVAERMRDAGLDNKTASADVQLGDARSAILRAASHDTDLVVMGSRGGGGIGQALLGSVARAVLRAAPGPVLVLTHRSQEAAATDPTHAT